MCAPPDCPLFAPGDPHQITNVADTDLLYYLIAYQPPVDVIHYPDSNKWTIKPQRKYFRMLETDYFTGEDE